MLEVLQLIQKESVFPKQFSLSCSLGKRHWPQSLAAPLQPCVWVLSCCPLVALRHACELCVLLLSSFCPLSTLAKAVSSSVLLLFPKQFKKEMAGHDSCGSSVGFLFRPGLVQVFSEALLW